MLLGISEFREKSAQGWFYFFCGLKVNYIDIRTERKERLGQVSAVRQGLLCFWLRLYSFFHIFLSSLPSL
jgi:hypothetical protein